MWVMFSDESDFLEFDRHSRSVEQAKGLSSACYKEIMRVQVEEFLPVYIVVWNDRVKLPCKVSVYLNTKLRKILEAGNLT
jgi:hypothetical protein